MSPPTFCLFPYPTLGPSTEEYTIVAFCATWASWHWLTWRHLNMISSLTVPPGIQLGIMKVYLVCKVIPSGMNPSHISGAPEVWHSRASHLNADKMACQPLNFRQYTLGRTAADSPLQTMKPVSHLCCGNSRNLVIALSTYCMDSICSRHCNTL